MICVHISKKKLMAALTALLIGTCSSVLQAAQSDFVTIYPTTTEPAACSRTTPELVYDSNGNPVTVTINGQQVQQRAVPRSYADIAYANVSSAQKLDIYLPSNTVAPYKVIVWAHPGGWSGGDKYPIPYSIPLCSGYAVVSINYRLSGEAKFPAQINDVKAAIRYIRANASTYNFDTNHIAIYGASAGGHLAALTGTSGGVASLEDLSLGNSGFSSLVQAYIDWYGPNDFATMDAQTSAQGCSVSGGHGASGSPESSLLGCTVGSQSQFPNAAPYCTSSQIQAASPNNYIDVSDPPGMIMHGTSDCNVPYGQSVEFDTSLRTVGALPQSYFVDGAGHGDPQGGPYKWSSIDVWNNVLTFLGNALGKPPTVSITANNLQVYSGASFTLTWSAPEASSCSASGSWTGSKSTSGSQTLNAPGTPGTYSYKLTCNEAGGQTANDSATISVAPPPVTITANPQTIYIGSSVTLNWSSSGMASCNASGDSTWTGGKSVSGSQSVQPTTVGQHTFTLTCARVDGSQANASTTVLVQVPPPTVTLNASSSAIQPNQTVTFTWSSTNATSCQGSTTTTNYYAQTLGTGWEGPRPLSGTLTTSKLGAGYYEFKLVCVNSASNTSVSAVRGVTVMP